MDVDMVVEEHWDPRKEVTALIEAVIESQPYEYKMVELDPNNRKNLEQLNALGRRRWLVTCMTPLSIELRQKRILVMLRRRLHPVRYLPRVGSQCSWAKLDEGRVREIKRLIKAAEHTHSQIAKMFSVSQAAIAHIASGRNWAHVKME
jgi:hypothetical protein